MWWGTRDPSLTLAQNQQQSRRYTPAFAQALKAAGANVYVHSLTDATTVQSFWDQGVGVYSNEPFPPLS